MKTAMILAAGRGERLKPLTNSIPKAMCLVGGMPLIEHHVSNLVLAGFNKIVINHAYLGGVIRRHLGTGAHWGVDICYSPEPPGGLETGGGIVNALPLLGDNPFITVNADIYSDFDFTELVLPQGSLLHLVVTPNNPLLKHCGDFGIDANQRLKNSPAEYTFAGIACYDPQLFEACKPGRYSVTPLIRQLVENQGATASIHSGMWFDIGSKARLAAANAYLKP